MPGEKPVIGPSLREGVKEGGRKLFLLLVVHAEREESAFLSPLPAAAQVPAVLGPPPLLHSPLSVLDMAGQQSRKLF